LVKPFKMNPKTIIYENESQMKYLRWVHIEDYVIKYKSYIEDKSIDIIEDESIDPKNPVITIEDESADIIEDESIDPKKIVPVIIIED
jgi:hypothetical protein